MDKPVIHNITTSYRSKAVALNDGVAYENLDDRNLEFYQEEEVFSADVKETADYVEYALNIVSDYTDTKVYFDEMLKDGTYLNDLQAYESRIIQYHNDTYSTDYGSVNSTIFENLSARDMEQLTIPLLEAVVYPEHKTEVLQYYAEFRSSLTNEVVYNKFVDYLTPKFQGISRIISEASDEYTQDLDAKITEAETTINSLTDKITTANTEESELSDITDTAIVTKNDLIAYINAANINFDGGNASTVYLTGDTYLDGGGA